MPKDQPRGLPGGYVVCGTHDRAYKPPKACPLCPRGPAPKEFADAPGVPTGPRRSWSAAIRTTCTGGHKHPSKMEARVCERLTMECAATGDTLLQQVRLPLVSSAPNDKGRPGYLSIDFGIVTGGRLARLIDAKSKRVSRDWARGARACESSWGIKIEEVSE